MVNELYLSDIKKDFFSAIKLDSKVVNFLFAFLAMFLIFYSPRKGGVDFGTLLTYGFGGLAFLYRVYLRKKINWLEAVLGYFCLYAFVAFAVAGLRDWQNNGYYFFRVFRSVSILYLIYFFYDGLKLTTNDILKIFFLMFGVHVGLVFLQYFSPLELRKIFVSLNPVDNPNQNLAELNNFILGGQRVKGAMSGFDTAGIVVAYFVAMGIVLFKNSLIRLALIMLGFVGVFITSRTGLVVYLGIIAFYYLVRLIYQPKITIKEILALLLISGIGFTVVFTFFSNSNFVTKSLRSSFEIYYNFKEKGSLRVSSLDDTLHNHMVIAPKDVSLFGHAEKQVFSTDGKIKSAGQSDCGYLQVLANFGIPNVILLLAVHLVLMYLIYRDVRKLNDIRYIIILMFLLACIKGPYFFGRIIFDLIIFLGIAHLKRTEQKQLSFEIV